jgi:hypothetical protein
MRIHRPVTVLAVFHLVPGGHLQWRHAWFYLRQLALLQAECREFELLWNPHDERQCVALSTWDSAAAFHRFARTSGLLWIDRCHGYTGHSPKYCVLEPVPARLPILTSAEAAANREVAGDLPTRHPVVNSHDRKRDRHPRPMADMAAVANDLGVLPLTPSRSHESNERTKKVTSGV